MTVQEMLDLKYMKKAKLVAGKHGIDNEIKGVNVLEATDISNWGRAGEVILTSFFALQNLSEEELCVFFDKLSRIGISAVVVKMDRLLTVIPNKIVELCEKHVIPLLQIGGDIKYEMIILEILGPIVNRNISLLDRYYEVHGELTKLAFKRPSIEEILKEFKKMLNRDISFVNITKNRETTTNKNLCKVDIVSVQEVLNTGKYMNFKYERNTVVYSNLPDKPQGSQIRVSVPYLGYDEYELVVHELTGQLGLEDFMVLENAVKLLQMELLKKFVVSQSIAQQKNNIIGDLLNDRLYEEKDVDEVLDSLGANKYPYYQVIIIKLTQRDENKNIDSNVMLSALLKVKLKVKNSFQNLVFMEKNDRIVFMQNLGEEQKGISNENIEYIMCELMEDKSFDDFYYTVSISSKVEKTGIPQANREALDTQNILRLFYNENKILAYEELGIYKLFLDANSLGDLRRFVSPKIAAFRDEYPLLFETLGTFLDTNQNYNITSERLFLHPKTVRYRIDKIKNMLEMNFNNPEEILQMQIASRLFRLIDGRKNSD